MTTTDARMQVPDATRALLLPVQPHAETGPMRLGAGGVQADAAQGAAAGDWAMAAEGLLVEHREALHGQVETLGAHIAEQLQAFADRASELLAGAREEAAAAETFLRSAEESAAAIRAAAHADAERVTAAAARAAEADAAALAAAAQVQAEKIAQDAEAKRNTAAAERARADERINAADESRRTAERRIAEAEKAEARSAAREARTDRALPRLALATIIILTSTGEFELAKLVGWPWWLAWAFPVAIDSYVVAAFRKHRDDRAAVMLMVALMAVSHLAGANVIATDRVVVDGIVEHHTQAWLIAAVPSILPIVLMRVHVLLRPLPQTAKEQLPAGRTAAATPRQFPVEPPMPEQSAPRRPPAPQPSAAQTPAVPAKAKLHTTAGARGQQQPAPQAPRGRPAGRGRHFRAPEHIAAVRARIQADLDARRKPSPSTIASEFEEDPEWVRNQIRAATK
ncbi:hypothetical protein [Kitasatospora sp. NPDC088783]|uniref:hypothetical protein n=1 Tax=Kitasatospora sp. NPDC088783 TaxID=3364077 RepID=UPI00382B2FCD